MIKRKQLKTKSKKKVIELSKELESIKKDFDEIECEVVDFGNKDSFGRPTVMTEFVKDKLLTAFAFGCTNREAALFAGIAERTMDNYFKKFPEFKEYCKSLKDKPSLQARQTLIKAIKESPYFAFKYLERKNPTEFGLKVKHSIEEVEELSGEEWEELNKLIDENF